MMMDLKGSGQNKVLEQRHVQHAGGRRCDEDAISADRYTHVDI